MPKFNFQTLPFSTGEKLSVAGVPEILAVVITPLVSDTTVIVASFVLVAPPSKDPSTVNVSAGDAL